MLGRVCSQSTGSSPFSSQSVGNGFLSFVKSQQTDSVELQNALDFITSPLFVSSFGSSEFVDVVVTLVSGFPNKSGVVIRVLTSLIGSPLLIRVADHLEELPDNFFEAIPEEIKSDVAKIFSQSINDKVREAAMPYTDEDSHHIDFDFSSPIVSISDVFNESVSEVDNPSKSLQFIEQFQPFTVKDIAEFILSLVSENSPIIKGNNDRNSVLQYLRPFKGTKVSIDQLVAEFDKEFVPIQSQTSVQLFITCLREVANARSVSAAPFLGQWKYPLTQLNFLSQIMSMNPLPITLPKPQQIARMSSVIIGDFKADQWRCSEFINTLVYLYDYSPSGVDDMLKEWIDKGPGLLLLVLAQEGKTSNFAAHLTRLMIMSQTQYMPGFSALWAANQQFMVDVLYNLYQEQHGLLGRIIDILDDLAVFDKFLEMATIDFQILLHLMAFFRRGNAFHNVLKVFYEKDKSILDIAFQIFENPMEFGLHVPMKAERKVHQTEEVSSADLLFFGFIDGIYGALDAQWKQRVETLFDKCIFRTPKLQHFTFNWRQKNPPQSPKSPTPAKDSDYLEFAVTPDARCINRVNLYVNNLLTEVPKDRNTALANGHALGKLLAGDLLNEVYTTKALQMIDQYLSQKETSNVFHLAVSALEEMKERFDLYMPFTRHIIGNAQFKKYAPEIHAKAVAICAPKEQTTKLEPRTDVKLHIDPALMRFKYVKPLGERIVNERMLSAEIVNKDVDGWDIYAMHYMKMEIAYPGNPAFPVQQFRPQFISVCIEAAVYKVYELITSPNALNIPTRCALARLGRWIGTNTISKSIPLFSRLLDIPNFIIYCYQKSLLSSGIPFIAALFESPAPVFRPPNPWTLSILSILSGIVRIPYLRYSLASTIRSIFSVFKLTPASIDPHPIHRVDMSNILDNDFFYPPIDFTCPISPVSAAKLFDGDLASLFHIVNRHFTISLQAENLRSAVVRDVTMFVYNKVPAIATSAATTAFSLVLKDFARSCDTEAVKRHSAALLHQCINALSMMSVALLSDPSDIQVDRARRNVLNGNAKWIDLLVRQLAFHIASEKLQTELAPIQKLRSETQPFWDVKSLPPAVALKLPPQLWPQEVTDPGTYTRVHTESALVASGIYECHSVESEIKSAYNELTVNPLSLSAPDVYLSELPINTQLATTIFSNFNVSSETGEIVSVKHIKPPNTGLQPVPTVATIVYCFPPMRPLCVGEYGAEVVDYLLGNLDQGKDPQAFQSLQGQIYFLLRQQMPDMRVFVQLAKHNLISKRGVEVLAMNFIDQNVNKDANFVPLIDFVYDVIQSKLFKRNELERLLGFLCTHDFSGDNLSNETTEHLKFLRQAWSTYERPITKPEMIRKTSSEAVAEFFKNPEVNLERIRANFNYMVDGNSRFWDMMITTSFPDGKTTLLKVLYAAIHFIKENGSNYINYILQYFLRSMFNVTVHGNISVGYFASVMANVVIQLREYAFSTESALAKTFGGFLNDTQPNVQPRFAGAWLYLFPLIIQTLLLDEELLNPTARLVVSLLATFNRFPADWGKHQGFRKMYKSILRIILLIIHDAPRFAAGYYHDFVSVIPDSFKKLKNIILCACPPGTDNPPLLSGFLTVMNANYEKILSGQYGPYENIVSEWAKPAKQGGQGQGELGRILLYAFKYHVRGEIADSAAMSQQPMWIMVKRMLLAAKTENNAVMIIETIFDLIRFPCAQTRLFSLMMSLLWEQNINWDGVTIQDVIFWVLMARTDKMETVPEGTEMLKKQLAETDKFKELMIIYQQ